MWFVATVIVTALALMPIVGCKTSDYAGAASKIAKKTGLDDKVPYAKEVADVCNFLTEKKCTKKNYQKCVEDLGKKAAKSGSFKKSLKCRAKCANKAKGCSAYTTCAKKC